MDLSTSTSSEPQIDVDLATPQLNQIDTLLEIITSKDSSTNAMEKSKDILVYGVIQSLNDHTISLTIQNNRLTIQSEKLRVLLKRTNLGFHPQNNTW